jgi:hypothetical protein
MSNTSNAPVESEQAASLQLAIAQTDALLKEVNEQMTLGTFDAANQEVLARLIERSNPSTMC